MGISSKFASLEFSSLPPEAIVLVEWESSPGAPSPGLGFWIVHSSPQASNQSLPVPVAVSGRDDDIASATTGSDGEPPRGHLPPVLMYSGSSSSIMMHNLALTESGIDMTLTRWSPGIRLAQVRPMGNLFAGLPAGLNDAQSLSPASIVRSEDWRIRNSTVDLLLTAIAMANEDGSLKIKYRAKPLDQGSFLQTSASDSYKCQEQTVRTVVHPESPSLVAWPLSASTIPVFACEVGSHAKYLVLVTLGQNRDKSENLLSLYITGQHTVLTESISMLQREQDHGIRWQVQTFSFTHPISNIAPITVIIDRVTYIVMFYFCEGALQYAIVHYEGSGSFAGFRHHIPCVTAPVTEPREPVRVPTITKTANFRWSISTHGRPAAKQTEAEPSPESEPAEVRDNSLPSGATACQPYAILSNGFIWVFYQGSDLNGKYVRRKIPKDVANLNVGWEAASWAVETGDTAATGPRHFIPLTVPDNFMRMR